MQPTELLELPWRDNTTLFLSGPSGSGKTSLAVQRLLRMLAAGVPGHTILVWLPQRTAAYPYRQALLASDAPETSEVTLVTLGGIARRTIDLFWPLIAEEAGFDPRRPPTFLTLETAQYVMRSILEPYVEQHAFGNIRIHPGRLATQIIDNLNKAAVVGFPIEEIATRLKRGLGSDHVAYDRAQACALQFRAYCREHQLLDFSLQVEIFLKYLWPHPDVRAYLLGRYRHLIADNVEEDVPATHDLLREWLENCESAWILMDTDGGYRSFLGADPRGAADLASLCRHRVVLKGSHVASPALLAFGADLVHALGGSPPESPLVDHRSAWQLLTTESGAWPRYHHQMLDMVVGEIARLVHGEGVPPGEIAVLAPFLPDVLRFSLLERLERSAIPAYSHRPSRPLEDEPATQCILTLSALAQPQWGYTPTDEAVAHALTEAIEDLDLSRAHLLTRILYRPREGQFPLLSFDAIQEERTRQRITYLLGERYEILRTWLAARVEEPPYFPDHLFALLFDQLLGRPGFRFHDDLDRARTAGVLVESARKFRLTLEPVFADKDAFPALVGREYIRMLEEGVFAAQYLTSWASLEEEAVLVTTVYSFLLRNRPVAFQFWIDVGSVGWGMRIHQPLTHPYVLSRHWPSDAVWGDADEIQTQQRTLRILLLGLVRRCRRRIYLATSILDLRGYEQRGPILHALTQILRRQAARLA